MRLFQTRDFELKPVNLICTNDFGVVSIDRVFLIFEKSIGKRVFL